MAQLSSRNAKELKLTTDLVKSQEDHMDYLTERVEDMGGWSLWWDANGFFRKSNGEVLKDRIQEEKAFYSEVKDALQKIRNADDDAEEKVFEVMDKLAELEEAMKNKTENSKLLEEKYNDFIEVAKKLSSKLNRMEAIAVRQQLDKVRKMHQETLARLDVVHNDLQVSNENCNRMTNQFNTLMLMNEQLLTQQQQLREENVLIKTVLERLVIERN